VDIFDCQKGRIGMSMAADRRIYLDNNATTPLDPRVLDAMLPFFKDKFGNASSRNHSFGWEADEAVQYAREQVANLIGASPKEIIFTSGATESNNLALKGMDQGNKKGHMISCLTEHKAVLDPLKSLESAGLEVSYLPVNSTGLIDLKELKEAIKDNTSLISIMFANNEIGIIQPLKEIGEIAKENKINLMSDATQALGKIPVDVNDLGIDLMSFSAHKMYGPKGIGALFIKSKSPRIEIAAQLEGGGHEKGIRSGTLNVPGIVGLGKACEIASKEMTQEAKRLEQLRNRLESELLTIEGSHLNSHEPRLPNMTNIAFDGVDGEQLLLSLKDIAVSQGSACTSSILEPSHVLKSIGLSSDLTFSSLRFGLGRFNTEEDIELTIHRVKESVAQLKWINEGN
jgi:cysteine desulfurase